jgi:hypothetical protein
MPQVGMVEEVQVGEQVILYPHQSFQEKVQLIQVEEQVNILLRQLVLVEQVDQV